MNCLHLSTCSKQECFSAQSSSLNFQRQHLSSVTEICMSGESSTTPYEKKEPCCPEQLLSLPIWDSWRSYSCPQQGRYTTFSASEQSDIHQTVCPHDTSHEQPSKVKTRSWQAWYCTSDFELYFAWKTAIGTMFVLFWPAWFAKQKKLGVGIRDQYRDLSMPVPMSLPSFATYRLYCIWCIWTLELKAHILTLAKCRKYLWLVFIWSYRSHGSISAARVFLWILLWGCELRGRSHCGAWNSPSKSWPPI